MARLADHLLVVHSRDPACILQAHIPQTHIQEAHILAGPMPCDWVELDCMAAEPAAGMEKAVAR